MQAKRTHPSLKPAAFFDVDGTIIDGDITEGHAGENGFTGLLEVCIRKGLVPGFSDPSALSRLREIMHKEALVTDYYPYMYAANVFAGLSERQKEAIRTFMAGPMQKIVSEHVFSFAAHTLEFCRAADIDVYFISASPHIFVYELGPYFSIPQAHCFGIDPDENSDFVNHAHGKAERVQYLCRKKQLKPVLSMGNRWQSDGAMLEHVVRSGGISVLVNDSENAVSSRSLMALDIR